MTNLCSICRQFDLNVFRGHGVLQSDATYAALSLDKTIYGREEQDYLRSFKAAFVKDGERKGCDFCRLLWDVTKGARNSVQQLNLRHFSIHLRAMVLPGRDNCEPEDSRTRWRINHDTRAYPLGPQVVTEFPMGKGPLKLTHFEVIFDEFDSAESMYHGKIHVHAARDSAAALSKDIVGTYRGIDTSSAENLKWLTRRIQSCEEHHRQCRRTLAGDYFIDDETSVPLPTRAIDVFADPPQLIETGDGQRSSYIALSYTWGRDQGKHLKTTRESFQEHLRAIPIHKTPQTIRHAIDICRRLDKRYLWVDALCIIQDDGADFAKEIPKMGQYYEYAWLTIVAAGASDSDGGCYINGSSDHKVKMVKLPYVRTDRQGSKETSFEAYISPSSFYKDVVQSDWWSRGWTVQERLMARRVAYFAKGHLYFECQKPQTLSAQGEVVDRWGKGSRLSVERETTLRLRKQDTPYTEWYQVVEKFTKCSLSKKSDKIPALAGMAKELRTQYGPSERYEWGLWLGDRGAGLLWRPDSEQESGMSELGAPSWSWSKMASPVKYGIASMKDIIGTRSSILKYWPKFFRFCSLKNDEMMALELKGYIGQLTIGTGCLPTFLQHRIIINDAKIGNGDLGRFQVLKQIDQRGRSHTSGWCIIDEKNR